MSYPSITSLPAAVRADLPIEAQQLYRTAYNTAWTKYNDFADRAPFCHRLARAEVRRTYGRHASSTGRAHVVGNRVVQEV